VAAHVLGAVASGAVSDADAEQRALRRVLAADAPPEEWFEPAFLQRYPYRVVRQTVQSFLERHGPLVDVEREDGRWLAVYEHGREPVVARVTEGGLIAGLGIGAAAVGSAGAKAPRRSVAARRIAFAVLAALLVPPALAVAAWTAGGRVDWAIVTGLAVVTAGGAWYTAPWHVPSRLLRTPVAGGSALAAVVSAVRLPDLPTGGVPWLPAFALGVVVVLGGISLGLTRSSPEPPLELALFPLGAGTYDVVQGGRPEVNQHARNDAQRAALDVVALGPLGTRCVPPSLYPASLERYAIFDRPVHAPCAGSIAEAAGDVPDLEPPLATPDRAPGNYVAIETDGVVVVLAHLRRGSVLVTAGDRVVAGQALGRVGNSGSTTEPHLHVHAERDGRAVPIVFAAVRKRPLRRNDVVRVE
jgi:Peptidase family M23